MAWLLGSPRNQSTGTANAKRTYPTINPRPNPSAQVRSRAGGGAAKVSAKKMLIGRKTNVLTLIDKSTSRPLGASRSATRTNHSVADWSASGAGSTVSSLPESKRTFPNTEVDTELTPRTNARPSPGQGKRHNVRTTAARSTNRRTERQGRVTMQARLSTQAQPPGRGGKPCLARRTSAQLRPGEANHPPGGPGMHDPAWQI
jgi:hypothetical protein